MIERSIQRDTLGLGHWREPADWCKAPFSHTVTTVADITGMVDGWQIYNSGVVVTLAVQPIEGAFRSRGLSFEGRRMSGARRRTTAMAPAACSRQRCASPSHKRKVDHQTRIKSEPSNKFADNGAD
jgi:hypothetical protein